MSVPQITVDLTPPSIGQSVEEFNAQAYIWTGNLQTGFQPQANAVATFVNQKAVDANAAATAAQTARTQAQTASGTATSAATTASTAATNAGNSATLASTKAGEASASAAAALASKNAAEIAAQQAAGGGEPTILPGTTDQYWRGDKTWRDLFADVRASTLTGLSTATNAVITAADTVLSALGKLQKQHSDHAGNTNNPHSVTKAQVGLSNVDNTSDAAKPISTATQTALDSKQERFWRRYESPTGTWRMGHNQSVYPLKNIDLRQGQPGGTALLVDDDSSVGANVWPSSRVNSLINDRYGKDNILGTVSQSSGVPTGAIIERGSNANGEYAKFADGTLLMKRTAAVNTTISSPQTFNFPAAFVGDRPAVSLSAGGSAPGRDFMRDYSLISVSSAWQLEIYTTRTIESIDTMFFAYGRWY